MLSCLALRRCALLLAAIPFTACTPTLDWREVRPEASGAVLLFPCKPSAEARNVTLAGTPVRMHMAVCRAGEITWALTYADVADPGRIASALEAMRAAAEGNLSGRAELLGPYAVPGMTPNPLAQRMRLRGQLPGGAAVTQELGFFSRGTWVFQATVMGAAPSAEAVAIFFDSIKRPAN